MKRRETGALGEQLACEFLGNNGYRIIERNFRCPGGEADIVAMQKDILVFVEVRTKCSRRFGTPEESITPAKMEKLRNVAAYYWQSRKISPRIGVSTLSPYRWTASVSPASSSLKTQ